LEHFSLPWPFFYFSLNNQRLGTTVEPSVNICWKKDIPETYSFKKTSINGRSVLNVFSFLWKSVVVFFFFDFRTGCKSFEMVFRGKEIQRKQGFIQKRKDQANCLDHLEHFSISWIILFFVEQIKDSAPLLNLQRTFIEKKKDIPETYSLKRRKFQ